MADETGIFELVRRGNITDAIAEMKTMSRDELAMFAQAAGRVDRLAWQVHDAKLREERTEARGGR